jgi:hypothetical protein
VPGILLGVLAALALGAAGTPARALGPGTPPVIVSASAFVNTSPLRFGGAAQLVASATVEVPGGNVPLNVQSVTVTVPGIGSPFTMPLQRLDLAPEREYSLTSPRPGSRAFPPGPTSSR